MPRFPLPRLLLLTVPWLVYSACGDAREEAGSRFDAPQRHGASENYGDSNIGYKGKGLSNAAALTGDQSSASASPALSPSSNAGFAAPSSSGAPWYGGSAGGSAGTGGSVSSGATIPVATPGGASAPVEAPYRDAAVALDAGSFAVDAALVSDSAAPYDATAPRAEAGPDAESADAGPPVDAGAQGDGSGPDAAATVSLFDGATPRDDGGPNANQTPARGDAAVAVAKPDAAVTAPTAAVTENPFVVTKDEAAATFAIDVDTGSYTLSRASINAGRLPDPKSVRVEEFLNYFHFHYAQPQGPAPLSVYTELGECPWNAQRQLLLVGIQGQEVELNDQPPANLVFLFDVSGSMNQPNKLPLLKKGFRMLVSQLRPQDRVAIVTYAGRNAVALPSTPGDQKATIMNVIDRLEAAGSTNGAGGIQKAYELAQENFMPNGNNRVLLATDGDFNVGLSATPDLVRFISEKRKTGVSLSVYGFGDAWNGGNYKDEVGEQLADNGDGIYFYVDSPEEARRAFLESVSGSLLTVAKDVKVQLELNPDLVKAYRLIGYENRVLANSAFSNDKVDGGELGAGLSVTALFELIPANSPEAIPAALPGSTPMLAGATAQSGQSETFDPLTGDDFVEVRLRYKEGRESQSKLVRELYSREILLDVPSAKFAFAAGVSELAQRLRHSQYLGAARDAALLEQLSRAKPLDREGAVEELLQLARKALELGASKRP